MIYIYQNGLKQVDEDLYFARGSLTSKYHTLEEDKPLDTLTQRERDPLGLGGEIVPPEDKAVIEGRDTRTVANPDFDHRGDLEPHIDIKDSVIGKKNSQFFEKKLGEDGEDIRD